MNCILLIFLIIVFFVLLNIVLEISACNNKFEHLTDVSNEAIQTIGSMYNTDKITVNNADIMNNLSSSNLSTNTIKSKIDSESLQIFGEVQFSNNVNTSRDLVLGGKLCFGTTCLTVDDFKQMQNFIKMKDRMYNNGAKIYDNVFDALTNGTISKSGNPNGWDETSYNSDPWHGTKKILCIGTNTSYPDGLAVNVPVGMSVIWVRALNERWLSIKIYDSDGIDLGTFATGYRNLNPISPNGDTADSYWNLHKWMPIPVPSNGKYVLCSSKDGADGWISGLALSTNPWNHASNSAVAYYWGLNGGLTSWQTSDWNNDQVGIIEMDKVSTLYVPVVPSGNDKLFYLIDQNTNLVGIQHVSISVNDVAIERFVTSYLNPFATHFNSKAFNRYVAAKIPKELIKSTDRFLKITIDMTGMGNPIYFRECGTHDYL